MHLIILTLLSVRSEVMSRLKQTLFTVTVTVVPVAISPKSHTVLMSLVGTVQQLLPICGSASITPVPIPGGESQQGYPNTHKVFNSYPRLY